MSHRLDVGWSMMGGLGAFAYGVAMHKARRAAYVEAVREGRERDALHRRIRQLEAALAAQQRQADRVEVSRRLSHALANLSG